jgi:DNA-binding NarL/FixJ family response regulator
VRQSSTAVSVAITVLIADSNRMQAQLLTSALRRRSEFCISTCPVDIASILQAVASTPAKVVVLSLNYSVNIANQMAAMRRVHLSHPSVAKVLLVESYDRGLVVSAFRSGARGIFCIADTHFRLLCRCIQRVADGQIWANTEQMTFLLDLISEVPSLRVLNSRGHQLLTPREEQVVALVAEGLSNRDTARELNLSEHTIKKYLFFRIFDKLGISSRVELVLYALNHGDPLQAEWLAAGMSHSPPDSQASLRVRVQTHSNLKTLPPHLYKSWDGTPCLTTPPILAPILSRAERPPSPRACCSLLLRWSSSIPAVERS